MMMRMDVDNNKGGSLADKGGIANLNAAKSGSNQQNGEELGIEEKVAILDFGAQYGKVIDRRIRECNVYSDILPFSTTMQELLAKDYKAIVISGGPNSVYVENAPRYDPELFNGKLPVLGICYGFQLINKHFGGTVHLQPRREDGQVRIKVDNQSDLFIGLEPEQHVLLTHGDGVIQSTAASDFRVIAFSGDYVAGIANAQRRIYGVQFHPEVDLTHNGSRMMSNFLRRVCALKCTYTLENREHHCLEQIRKTVGKQHVMVLVSGGVDSTVCAALCTRALGPDRVHTIHIDNGFMRLDESDHVVRSLEELGLGVHRFNCITEFLEGRIMQNGMETDALRMITSPEDKRKIIGDTFICCKDLAMAKLSLGNDVYLVQGTLRPDLIESASELASGCADVIKTHHNDSALVRELRDLGKVVEPLKDFHKDEVRELGRSLGLPEKIVHRHPFPGPGLAIRILCADEPFKDDQFEETRVRVREITQGIDPHLDCILLPIKSVGVQGDRRTYSYVAALICCSETVGEASSENNPPRVFEYRRHIPWGRLEKLAQVLPTELHNINRVVFVFKQDKFSPVNDVTITHINEGTLQQLQQADHIVYQTMCGLDANGKPDSSLQNVLMRVQQMPVILAPVHFERNFQLPQYFPSTLRSIVLRPFITRDFMTGQAALPERDLPIETIEKIVHRIGTEMPTISRVMLDLTSKPPGTTEWE